MKETSYNKKGYVWLCESDVIPMGTSEINNVEIRCFFYLNNKVYISINTIVNRRSIMKNRDFSLLVIITTTLYIEVTTPDIFQTYP